MSNLKVPMEIYSRCSGYFRPVSNWNPGKKSEFSERRKMKFELTSEAEASEVR
jgi:ribonucleoside-triphosphate reductase